MTPQYASLAARVKAHDWSIDNFNARDLMTRLDLIKELSTIPMRDVREILRGSSPEVVYRIMALIFAICSQPEAGKE